MSDKDTAMNQSATLNGPLPLEDDGVLLRLLAMAMDKVQRKRRKPKKRAPLHRV